MISDSCQEAKLYAMLPLFCKIFNAVPPNIITEKFTDAQSFTQVNSKVITSQTFYEYLPAGLLQATSHRGEEEGL